MDAEVEAARRLLEDARVEARESSARDRDESNSSACARKSAPGPGTKALARDDLPLRRTLVVDMLWINYDPEAWWWRFVEDFVENGAARDHDPVLHRRPGGDQLRRDPLNDAHGVVYMKPFHEDEDDFMYIVGRRRT